MGNCCEIHLVEGTGHAPQFSQFQQYGAVSNDTFPFPHVIEFCKPSAGIWFNQNDEPPRYQCGDYTRNLDGYPLNDATLYDSITGNWKFGTSEMVLVYVRLENYPRSGGVVKIDFKNPAGQTFYTFQNSLPIPNPEWTSWYAWVWAVVGKFDKNSGFSGDEIIVPGTYRTVVSSPWGSANIDYDVTGSPPPVPAVIEIRNMQAGNSSYVNVYQNGVFVNDSRYRAFYDFFVGDEVEFQAVVVEPDRWVFEKWNVNGVDFYSNPIGMVVTNSAVATVSFTELIDTSGYSCLDNCQHLIGANAEFRTQGECMASACYEPPPVLCGNLPVDSWQPTQTKAALNESIPFTFRSKDPNKSFRLFYATLTGFENIVNASTDADGCYTGILPAQAEGRYDVKACYDVGGYCVTNLSGSTSITWGNPIGSWQDYLIYIPYAIGAYLLANLLGGRR